MTARLSPDASNRVYVPEIDGLRAIAVGAVLLYHLNAAFLPGGFTGVDVFFVISGYVVSASLGRDLQRAFPDFLMHFYARRMMRILPALLVCLLVTALATALLIPNAWLSDSIHKTGLYAFFGISNYALVGSDPYFAPRPEFNPFTHTWSLAVEEQFYLLYPILFFAAAHVKSTRLLLAILTISSLVYAAWIIRASPEAAFYLLPSRFWELGAGALLYQLQAARKLPESLVKPALPIGLGLILLAMMFAGREGVPFPWAVPAVLGAWLVLASVSSGTAASDPIARALRSGIMVWTGKLSYSLYLWHWPVYSLFRWTVGLEGLMGLVAVAMTVIIATLSFFWVEQPFRVASWLKAHAKAWVVVGGLASVLLTSGVGGEAAATAALTGSPPSRLQTMRTISPTGRRTGSDGRPIGRLAAMNCKAGFNSPTLTRPMSIGCPIPSLGPRAVKSAQLLGSRVAAEIRVVACCARSGGVFGGKENRYCSVLTF
jgi:peptidoglycan/LPS O-acetylase OafA/YrhL